MIVAKALDGERQCPAGPHGQGRPVPHSRETGFSFSHEEVEHLIRLIEASNEIYKVSKFDNSLSFGTKQNSLQQIFFALCAIFCGMIF